MKSFIVMAIACAAFADPQSSDQPPTIHAETRVVQIEVVVTDSHGKPIADLRKEDFAIFDNNKPRPIDIFTFNFGARSPEASPGISTTTPSKPLPPHVFSNRNPGPPDLPDHSTVILLDEANAWFENTVWARQGVTGLLDKVQPDEKIAVYVVSRKIGLVLIQDYTTDHALLLRNLEKYIPRDTSPCMTGAGGRPKLPAEAGIPCSGGSDNGSREDAETRSAAAKVAAAIAREKEYLVKQDAENARLSLQTLAEQLALVPGRKSVFWITQGFPPKLMRDMGQFAWEKTITALNEANVAVNTVDSNELSGYVRFVGSGGVLTMKQVAEETGGEAYFGRNDIDTAMADAIASSRTSYTLGFYLPENERDNKFHALKVMANRHGLNLDYRLGFYAGDTEIPNENRSRNDLEASLISPLNSTGVGITAKVETTADTIRIRLNLDPATISLKQTPNGWHGAVEETLIEQNETGNTLAKISVTKQFDIPAARRTLFDLEGASWEESIPLRGGADKITIVARDSASSGVGSLKIPLSFATPAEEPDVITVKPSPKPLPIEFHSNATTLTATNYTLRDLIRRAYKNETFRIEAPKNAQAQPFDITAKFPATATNDEEYEATIERVLQKALTEKFGLVAHRETKTVPVYELTVTKNGPKFKPTPDGTIEHTFPDVGRYSGSRITMAMLSEWLTQQTEKPVIDKTGLTSAYTLSIVITQPTMMSLALEEQLGLKIEPTKSQLEFLVVDQAHFPR